MLGPINFRPYMDGLDWIIAGCERTAVKKRRPMNIDWVQDIYYQCEVWEKVFLLQAVLRGHQARLRRCP